MGKLTNMERIMTALNLREPDLVPTFELIVDKKVRDAILPGASFEDFVEYMDLDAACYYDWGYDRYETVDKEKGLIRDKFGVLKKWTTEVDPVPIEANIKSDKDLENYCPPDPSPNKAPWKYEPIERAVKRFKGKRAVVASVVDVFYVVNEMLGMTNHLMNMILNPGLIDCLNEIVLNYNLEFIRNCIKIGVDIIWVTGDFAGNSGPLASPKHMERFAIQPLKAQVDECKKHCIPCLKHTDGNIWNLFDQIVNTGIAGIHPIDPGAGMDIGEAKAKYGNRVCLIGNIDCGALLTMGTEDDVRQAVKECIRKAGRGGGLICTSSNSIHSGVPARNYLSMIKAIREFGRYPLPF
jgi:uroporphyrinogen decarboxylase